MRDLWDLGLTHDFISIDREGLLPWHLYILIREDQDRNLSVLHNLAITVEVIGSLEVPLRVVGPEVTVDLTVHQLTSPLLHHGIAREVPCISTNRHHILSRLEHLIPICDGLNASNPIDTVQFNGYLALIEVPREVVELIDRLPKQHPFAPPVDIVPH